MRPLCPIARTPTQRVPAGTLAHCRVPAGAGRGTPASGKPREKVSGEGAEENVAIS
jgi:hypothetical protein